MWELGRLPCPADNIDLSNQPPAIVTINETVVVRSIGVSGSMNGFRILPGAGVRILSDSEIATAGARLDSQGFLGCGTLRITIMHH